MGEMARQAGATVDLPPEQLREAAVALASKFRDQSDSIEAARRIPAALSEHMASAGFYRLGAPRHVGGLESPPALSSEIFETLAAGDASCAWVSFIAATSGAALAAIPTEAAQAIFNSPETMMTGVFAPMGKAEKVAGGFRVSGRWQWGSGSQNADWVLAGCRLLEDGEPMLDASGKPRTHMVILPASEIEFIDTWHVSGLCGTGSLDYAVEDVFVPAEHVVGFLPADQLPEPTALYSFPNFTFLALGIGAVCMGIARAAIDELVRLAASKRRVGASKTIAEQSPAQVKLAEAEAALRSARLFYYDSLAAAWDSALADGAVPIDQRRNLRLATCHAVSTCTGVVDEMYHLGGGTAVYQKSPLQRYFRDIHVANSHIMVAPTILQPIGRLFFGIDDDAPTL